MAGRAFHENEYRGLFAEFYDSLHRGQTADVGLFRALARECGSPVLEMGCGTGRVLAPLVEDGHRVLEAWGSPRREPLTPASPEMIFVAAR